MNAQHLNETVYATLKPSAIQGIGVFAIRDIPKGTQISDYEIGENSRNWIVKISWQEFETILPEIKSLILDRMLFEEGKDALFISPNANQGLRGFMNHSTDPNSDGVITLRDIAACEEITEDYRAVATGELPELTKRHMPFLV